MPLCFPEIEVINQSFYHNITLAHRIMCLAYVGRPGSSGELLSLIMSETAAALKRQAHALQEENCKLCAKLTQML